MNGYQNWFRPMQGSTFHLEVGRERAAFGFSKIVTACGKSFFEGEKYLRRDKKRCAKCEAAQHRVHQTAGGRRSKKSKLVVPAAGNA